jgi:hypothetical protein
MRYPFFFLVSAFLSAAPVSAEELPRKIKPVMVWTGTESKQTKESFARCCSQKDWEASWHKHKGRDEKTDRGTCPEVDFDSYMVIVIFHGESYQNHGIDIKSVTEEKGCVRVRYRPSWYQVASVPGQAEDFKALETQTYAFVVLPRSEKAIVMEEDVRNLIPDPPVWKERAKLAALGMK